LPACIHEAFSQPKNKNSKIWKFMDFTKFMYLLANNSLYLSRASLFEDVFEGSIPKCNYQLYKEFLGANSDILDNLSNFKKLFKEQAFINCWHMNEHESAAMWNLYSKTTESIAIQTTYYNLEQLLPNDTSLGMIKYIDYEKDSFPNKYSLYEPFIHKRKSFEHEKEVRIFKMKMLEQKTNENFKYEIINPINGLNIELDLNKLIDIVYVNPKASSWFYDLVKDVVNKYKIDTQVTKSSLYQGALF
jgi:hypothetical protein